MACEVFGDGMLPQLQSAVYKVPWDMLVFLKYWVSCLSKNRIVVENQSQRNKGYISLPYYSSSKMQKSCITMCCDHLNYAFVFIFPQLETKFRDHTNKTMTEREEPFRCVVKFASTNLLESFKHCASSGNMNLFATAMKETRKEMTL